LEKVSKEINEILLRKDEKKFPMVFVRNQCDLKKDRKISTNFQIEKVREISTGFLLLYDVTGNISLGKLKQILIKF
jgi:GTPase SAR1 family protein